MGNQEFDKRVREMMDGHQEMPDSNSWDLIARDLERRRRGRVLYFRRSLTAAVAVAASLALLLLLDGPDEITSPPSLKHDIIISENTPKEEPVKVISPDEMPENKEVSRSVSDRKSVAKGVSKTATADGQEKKSSESVQETGTLTTQTQATQPQVITQEFTVKEQKSEPEQKIVQESKSEPDQKRANSSQSVEEYLFKQRSAERSAGKRSKAMIAMGTNISPSMATNSVTLMGVSQSGTPYEISNVVSTIQKAYVPMDVVSNTKFLMPVSVGVQVQLPVGKIVSLGTGVNYTLLFSNYDDLSREETRQTHQTLHYIGVPVNVYANVFSNENLRFYLSGGVTVEKGLYAHVRVFENGVKRWTGSSIEGLQWSLNAGAGAEFIVNRNTGLYFDPSIAYYFDNKQPISIRSAQPLQFKFELGFRFHL